MRTEVCENVGLFMLNLIKKKFKKENIGLYRDDGLALLRNKNGHQNDKFRKELTALFKSHKLNLEIKCNLKVVDYLDITFDLQNGTHKPFHKLNNDPRYINAHSNHPTNVIKQIAKSVAKRISTNSSNEQIFNESAPYYNNILKNCGYDEKINFVKPDQNNRNHRNRTRKIIWYNPPFSKNVKTNVAKK